MKTQFLDISFTSDNSINGLGFYATYEIMSELQSKVVIPRNGSGTLGWGSLFYIALAFHCDTYK